MTMASTSLSLTLSIILIYLASASSKFIEIKCKENQVAQFGQDTLLECVLITSVEVTEVTIRFVTWTRYPHDGSDREVVLSFYDGETYKNDGYSLAEPHWNDRDKNVSLLISKATVQHEGVYECEVLTNAGYDEKYISVNVADRQTTLLIPIGGSAREIEEAVLNSRPSEEPKPGPSPWQAKHILVKLVVIGSLFIALLLAVAYKLKKETMTLRSND